MQPFRQIVPAPTSQYPPLPYHGQDDNITAQTNPQRVVKRKRHREEEWTEIRRLTAQLILQHSLEETKKIIEERTGFYAGIRQWRNKLAEWGLDDKNMKREDMKVLVAKERKRKQELGKETVFIRRGIKIEDQRLSNFNKRAASVASPSAPTPQGIEYFTPRPTIDFSEAAVNNRRAEKAGARTAILELSTTRDLHANILRYDATRTPIRILECENMEVDVPGMRSSKLRHGKHLCGWNAVLASGRFNTQKKCEEYYWESAGLAQQFFVASTIGAPQAEDLAICEATSESFDAPAFRMFSSAPNVRMKPDALKSFLIIQHSSYIMDLFGLSREARSRWLQTWKPLVYQNEIQQLADYVFGDISKDYNYAEFVSLIICFKPDPGQHVLLRCTIGYNQQPSIQECRLCNQNFFVVDFIGDQGAVKVVLSGCLDSRFHGALPLSDLPGRCKFKEPFEIISDWALVSSLYHGQGESVILRRCRCRGEQHSSVETHYINEWDEQNASHWDVAPPSEPLESFNLFPVDGSWRVAVGDKSRKEKREQLWDPEGHDSEGEAGFEPFPEDIKEREFLSKPIYFHRETV